MNCTVFRLAMLDCCLPLPKVFRYGYPVLVGRYPIGTRYKVPALCLTDTYSLLSVADPDPYESYLILIQIRFQEGKRVLLNVLDPDRVGSA
jgi:hypothetical protein